MTSSVLAAAAADREVHRSGSRTAQSATRAAPLRDAVAHGARPSLERALRDAAAAARRPSRAARWKRCRRSSRRVAFARRRVSDIDALARRCFAESAAGLAAKATRVADAAAGVTPPALAEPGGATSARQASHAAAPRSPRAAAAAASTSKSG